MIRDGRRYRVVGPQLSQLQRRPSASQWQIFHPADTTSLIVGDTRPQTHNQRNTKRQIPSMRAMSNHKCHRPATPRRHVCIRPSQETPPLGAGVFQNYSRCTTTACDLLTGATRLSDLHSDVR